MASFFIVAIWVSVNLAAMALSVRLGLMPNTATRWTARDDLRLAQWSRGNTGWK